MPRMHHPDLRVNADVGDNTEEIWADLGWVVGDHPDTDLDDPRELRAVKPAPTPAVKPKSTPTPTKNEE